MLASIFAVLFFGLCLAGAAYDMNRLMIPNRVNFAIAALFLPAAGVAAYAGLPIEIIGGHLIAFAAAFMVSFLIFSLGIFGGGDAKMIPAVVLWIGPAGALHFVLYMAIAGAFLCLAILFVRRMIPVESIPGPLRAPFTEKKGVPYGIAIAAGAIAAAPYSPFLTGFLNQIGVFH